MKNENDNFVKFKISFLNETYFCPLVGEGRSGGRSSATSGNWLVLLLFWNFRNVFFQMTTKLQKKTETEQ